MTRTKVSITAATIAHTLAWAATLFFLFWPVYKSSSSDTSTLVEVNGLWSALLLVIPVALTAVTLIATLPAPTHPRILLTIRWASFALLLAFCAVSALSIGIFYLPAAIATLVLAIVGPSRRSQSVNNSSADALPQ